MGDRHILRVQDELHDLICHPLIIHQLPCRCIGKTSLHPVQDILIGQEPVYKYGEQLRFFDDLLPQLIQLLQDRLTP